MHALHRLSSRINLNIVLCSVYFLFHARPPASLTRMLDQKNKIRKILGARTFPARSFPPDGTTFSQITLGQKLTKEIPPYSYWNMQFYQSEPAYVKFDYSIPRGASIGVYARRNALPTHTQYHFKEVLSGFNVRTTRAATHVSYDLIIFCSKSQCCQRQLTLL